MGAGRGTDLVGEFRERPLVLAAVALALGLVAGGWWWSLLLGVIPLWLAGRTWRAPMVVAVGALGLFLSPWRGLSAVEADQPFSGVVDVVSVAKPGRFGEFVAVESARGRLVWTLPVGDDYNWGDQLRVRGEIQPLTGDSGDAMRRMGYSGRLKTTQVEMLEVGNNLARFTQAIRRGFANNISRHLRSDDAAMVRALTFNDDAEVSDELKEGLRTTGLIHIISTSGMHVMLMASLLMTMLRWIRVDRSLQLVVLALLLVLYVAAAGWRPPAVRAMILALLVLAPYIVKREADALSALAVGFLVTLLWQPYEIMNIGFQLSYVSVVALVMFGRLDWIAEEMAFGAWLRRYFWESLRISLVASIATAPLLAYHFGEFSWLGPIMNMLVGIVVLPIVSLSLLAALLPFAAGPVLFAVSLLCHYVRGAVEWASQFGGSFGIGSFPAWMLIVFYGAVILAWDPRRKLPTMD